MLPALLREGMLSLRSSVKSMGSGKRSLSISRLTLYNLAGTDLAVTFLRGRFVCDDKLAGIAKMVRYASSNLN